jgi:hypothetical protein
MVGGKQDDDLIEIRSRQRIARLRRSYRVTSKEMEAARVEGETDWSVLKRLIVERSALLDIDD